MQNKSILLLPSFAVAPDATLLWPRTMTCGCTIIKAINTKKELPTHPQDVEVLLDTCTKHFCDALIRQTSENILPRLFEDDYLPILTTSDVE